MAGRDFEPSVYARNDLLWVACSCGWTESLGLEAKTLLDVLNAIGEHNSAKHLSNDNQRLRLRRS